MTRDYTTLVLAAWADWSGLIITVWAACVAAKLRAHKPAASGVFIIAAIVTFLCVVIPANCAISAMTAEWTFPLGSEHTYFDRAVAITEFLVMLVCVVSPVFAILIAITCSD
ncbi:MAG: hypothetical protein VB131_04875 [Burkholderia gladioli]